MMAQIPVNLRRFLWGVERRSLNLARHRRFVIERMLEYGDEEAVRWVRSQYGDQAIRDTVCASRVLSRRTCNFWRLILNIPRKDIQCLSKRSRKQPATFWPD